MENKQKSLPEKELEILEFWDKDKTFEKSLEKNKNNENFVFYDGPPFATGLPHYGHLLASMEKDVIPRYQTMKGKYVRRVWGWDCHGLPIENIAEKELGINSKDEIEKMGVEKFNAFCRSKVLGYASEWKKIINRIGRWIDMDNAYKTMDNEFIESVWWIFKEMWNNKLIYEGEKILMYCPRCSTPLAKSEIAMEDAYKKVKDETLTVKFKLKDEDVYALAWTTTPWTLPANLALTVNPNLKYLYIKDKSDGTIYLLASDLVGKFFKSEDDYEVIKTLEGKELEGKKYEPLFPYFSDLENSFRIILGDFVTSEDGTGIVHTAPAFGEDDYNVCKQNGIDFISPVNEVGRFNNEVKDFAGQYIFDANKEIISFLKKEGKVVKIERKEHDYPFCHRCDTPLFYKAMPAVFVDIQKIKNDLLKSNETVNWYPDFLKDGRVKHTIETAPDWNLSRNRYWAAPIPLWKSDDGEILVTGSIEELKKYSKEKIEENLDLHKDFVDKLTLVKDRKEFRRIPDVFDCWFESGSMPYAQFHYPFENKDIFEKNYPADFIAEGLDQTRGWFYTLQVISTALFKKSPFKNVLVNGLILAEDGKKMSKKLNNYPDPMNIVNKYGVDTLRIYLVGSNVMNADNFNFSEKGVDEIYKKVLMIIHNVLNFYSTYPNIKENEKLELSSIIDKWIISRTNNLIKSVSISLDNYDTINASLKIKSFIDELSTWYVRRSRERFNDNDKNAKTVLKYVLENLSKVIAPIMPFSSEIIYKALGYNTSVHLEDWPNHDDALIDNDLESRMDLVRNIVSSGLRERDIIKIALKQPLLSMSFSYEEKMFGENEDELLEIIKEEMNVKNINKISENFDKNNLKIELDTTITSDLEAEGIAREIIRAVQSKRKDASLVKENFVELELIFDHKLENEIREYILRDQKKIGAENIYFKNELKNTEFSFDEKIKDFSIKISFNKIK